MHELIRFYWSDVNEIETESLQFDFSTIKAATNDFPDDNKLGQGGFGAVYKVSTSASISSEKKYI